MMDVGQLVRLLEGRGGSVSPGPGWLGGAGLTHGSFDVARWRLSFLRRVDRPGSLPVQPSRAVMS